MQSIALSCVLILVFVSCVNCLSKERSIVIRNASFDNETIENPSHNQAASSRLITEKESRYIPLRNSAYVPIQDSTSTAIVSRAASDIHRSSTESDIIRAVRAEEDHPAFKLTTEKLAYILIGTCCGLSILCLVVVASSLKFWEHYQTKLPRKRWSLPVYRSPKYNRGPYPPPYVYSVPRPPAPTGIRGSNISCKACSCKCTCATSWSLGPSNLSNSTPLLFGGKTRQGFGRKLPFGAASALHMSTMAQQHQHRPAPQPRNTSCSCQPYITNTAVKKHQPPTSSSSSSSSSSSRDPDFHPQCTCIEPPRRLVAEWDLSPDSLDSSSGSSTDDGPSWRACSYLVDNMHRHHHNTVPPGHQQQRPSSGSNWHNVIQNPLARSSTLGNSNTNSHIGVSWTSNMERLI